MHRFNVKQLIKITTSLSLCLPMVTMAACKTDMTQHDTVSEATKNTNIEDLINNKTYTADIETLGLTVDENGTILLAGKPYYAFGVNSFTLVNRYIEGADKSMYRDQFELLKKYNIPFIRVNFGGYWPDYYEGFDSDPQSILQCMKEVVECAEEYKIGLICSLLWYDGAIPNHVGEHRSDMGDPNSKTIKYAAEYTRKIVNEFKGSPAIWAWEIGNEYNLGADLCDPQFQSKLPEGPCAPVNPSGFDFYTSDELATFYTIIGKTIRECDTKRMISTGNADIRNASKSLRQSAREMDPKTHLWTEEWTQDSIEDFYEMNAFYTPDPIDTISLHLQHAKQDINGKVSYALMLDRFNSKVSTLKYFTEYVNAARKAKKALYFGEMGDLIWMEDDKDAINIFTNVTDWIIDAGIQLSSTWQFSANNLKATDEGIDGEKLKVIQDRNVKYASEGKADSALYWSNK